MPISKGFSKLGLEDPFSVHFQPSKLCGLPNKNIKMLEQQLFTENASDLVIFIFSTTTIIDNDFSKIIFFFSGLLYKLSKCQKRNFWRRTYSKILESSSISLMRSGTMVSIRKSPFLELQCWGLSQVAKAHSFKT